LNEEIHFARVFARQILFTIKIFYQPSKTGCESGSIKVFDQADATLAGEQGFPRSLNCITDRR
jgi:hypothetical protein